MVYKIEIKHQIAIFTIDRPEMRNAINNEVMEGLESFLDQIEHDKEVAFAVITGTGNKAFCSGGDLSEFHSFMTAQEALPMLSRMTGLLYRIATLPMPVIALLNGTAVGGGCEIATACDYRVVSSTARAGFIQGTLNITSGWGGSTLLLEKMGRQDVFLRFLSEAKIYNAQELELIGWATHIYEGDIQDGLQHFLADMKHIHPSVHRAYKKVAIRSYEITDLKSRMMEEAEQCAILWESEAHHQAVASFLSKKNR